MRLDRQTEDLADIAREAVDLYDLVSNERGVHIVTTARTWRPRARGPSAHSAGVRESDRQRHQVHGARRAR